MTAVVTNATLLTVGERPAVGVARYLPDPPSIVWRAITGREQLRSWFPCEVVVAGGDWTVGAVITFSFPPEVIDPALAGKVLAVDEPRLLAFSWGEEALRFELSPHESGTLLVASTSFRRVPRRETSPGGRRASTDSPAWSRLGAGSGRVVVALLGIFGGVRAGPGPSGGSARRLRRQLVTFLELGKGS